MPLAVTWAQALAWRLERQLLEPIGTLPAEAVVSRLCGVQAQVASTAVLAVRVRQQRSGADEVRDALADGRLLKTWAMRGTLHLLSPHEAGAFLSILAAGRSWELPSWQRYYGMQAGHWTELRAVVHDALAGPPLTRDELIAAVVARPGLAHIGEELRSGWGSLLKPLAWQGELGYGPPRGTNVTFTRPDLASASWAGVPEPDEAGPIAIAAYLRAYGPATVEHFSNWISRGRIARKSLRTWFASLGDRLAQVEVDGETAWVLAEDADELASARPTAALRLLPGFDQWVMGRGTEDGVIIPQAHRRDVSRQSGWIAPVATVGGLVQGTWELDGDRVTVAWFRGAQAPPADALDAEVARLAAIVGLPLTVVVRRA